MFGPNLGRRGRGVGRNGQGIALMLMLVQQIQRLERKPPVTLGLMGKPQPRSSRILDVY
jgi:hypothetical protein